MEENFLSAESLLKTIEGEKKKIEELDRLNNNLAHIAKLLQAVEYWEEKGDQPHNTGMISSFNIKGEGGGNFPMEAYLNNRFLRPKLVAFLKSVLKQQWEMTYAKVRVQKDAIAGIEKSPE